MEETQFMIKFVNGEYKKFDDDRFRLEIDEDGQYKVISRIHKNVVLEMPDKSNILYVQYKIIKRQKSEPEIKDTSEVNTNIAEDVQND